MQMQSNFSINPPVFMNSLPTFLPRQPKEWKQASTVTLVNRFAPGQSLLGVRLSSLFASSILLMWKVVLIGSSFYWQQLSSRENRRKIWLGLDTHNPTQIHNHITCVQPMASRSPWFFSSIHSSSFPSFEKDFFFFLVAMFLSSHFKCLTWPGSLRKAVNPLR